MRSETDHNSVYYIYKEMKLRSIISDPNSKNLPIFEHKLGAYSDPNLRILGKILVNDQLRAIMGYFCDYGAASNLVLEAKTGLPGGSVRRFTKQLKAWNILSPAINAPVNKKGGPHTSIHQVEDASAEQILYARELHFKLKNKKYMVGVQLAQALIEDYPTEINFKQIMDYVKTQTRFMPVDIATFAAEELHSRGIKVWR